MPVLESLHIFLPALHCTAARTSPSPTPLFLHVLRSLVAMEQSPSEESVVFQMLCHVEFCDAGKLAAIPQQQPTISIAETLYVMHVSTFFICASVMHLDYPNVQHNTATSQDTARARTVSTHSSGSSFH